MNRALAAFNLIGVVVLAGVCGLQWRADGRLQGDVRRLEQIRVGQLAKLVDDDRALKAGRADLDGFRARLKLAESELAQAQQQVRADDTRLRQAKAETDQLQASFLPWTLALMERDIALHAAGERIVALTADRNRAVQQCNEATDRYNKLVRQIEKH